jgi:hypothetical protein
MKKILNTHSAWSNENFSGEKKYSPSVPSLNGGQDFGSFASSATTELNNHTIGWNSCSDFICM